MASMIERKDRGRLGWLLGFSINRSRKQAWLGPLSKRQAMTIKRHVEELIRAFESGTRPEPESSKWANSLEGRLRDVLVKHGLAEPVEKRATGEEGRLLIPFLTRFVDEHRSVWKHRTQVGYGQVVSWASAFGGFSGSKTLASVTKGDLERWIRWMKEQGLADATVSKHAKRMRTMLESAVEDRLLDSNPAKGIRLGSETNPERQAYISREKVTKILESCPDHDWRLILALARFAGMRPGEIVRLKWTDLDWDSERIRIAKFKTKRRECPMFAPLKPMLLEASESAPPGFCLCYSTFPRFRWVVNASRPDRGEGRLGTLAQDISKPSSELQNRSTREIP